MKQILIVLLILQLFQVSAYAEGLTDQALGIFDTVQMENGLNGEEREIGGKIGPAGYDAGSALSRLWRSFAAKLHISQLISALSSSEQLASVTVMTPSFTEAEEDIMGTFLPSQRFSFCE